MMVIRFVISVLAIAMIVMGFIAMISPVPLGIFVIFLGLIILTLANPHARPFLKWIRERWPWLSKRLTEAQENTPPALSDPLKETEPDQWR